MTSHGIDVSLEKRLKSSASQEQSTQIFSLQSLAFMYSYIFQKATQETLVKKE